MLNFISEFLVFRFQKTGSKSTKYYSEQPIPLISQLWTIRLLLHSLYNWNKEPHLYWISKLSMNNSPGPWWTIMFTTYFTECEITLSVCRGSIVYLFLYECIHYTYHILLLPPVPPPLDEVYDMSLVYTLFTSTTSYKFCDLGFKTHE